MLTRKSEYEIKQQLPEELLRLNSACLVAWKPSPFLSWCLSSKKSPNPPPNPFPKLNPPKKSSSSSSSSSSSKKSLKPFPPNENLNPSPPRCDLCPKGSLNSKSWKRSSSKLKLWNPPPLLWNPLLFKPSSPNWSYCFLFLSSERTS